MLNNGGPRYKRSTLEKQMNQDVIWCVFILVLLCVIGAIGCGLWLNSYEHLTEPFKETDDGKEAFLAFWTFVIILQVHIILMLICCFHPNPSVHSLKCESSFGLLKRKDLYVIF